MNIKKPYTETNKYENKNCIRNKTWIEGIVFWASLPDYISSYKWLWGAGLEISRSKLTQTLQKSKKKEKIGQPQSVKTQKKNQNIR